MPAVRQATCNTGAWGTMQGACGQAGGCMAGSLLLCTGIGNQALCVALYLIFTFSSAGGPCQPGRARRGQAKRALATRLLPQPAQLWQVQLGTGS